MRILESFDSIDAFFEKALSEAKGISILGYFSKMLRAMLQSSEHHRLAIEARRLMKEFGEDMNLERAKEIVSKVEAMQVSVVPVLNKRKK